MMFLSLVHHREHPRDCLCFCSMIIVLATFVFLVTKTSLKWLFRHNDVRRESRAPSCPPGSLGFPIIGETLQFMAAINSPTGFYDFVKTRRLRYGSCFKTSIFGETHVFVSSKDAAKMILSNEQGKLTKRYLKSIAELVGRRSLLCASHHHHKLIRSSLTNLFSTSSLSIFVKHFDQVTVDTLSGWEQQGTIIVHEEALKITFKAMCKLLMSMEGEDELDLLLKDVTTVCKAMLSFPLKLPGTRFYNGIQARKRIMDTLEKEIWKRREHMNSLREDDHEDFLDHLVAMDQSVHKLSDEEIKDNILTMIIAGVDTTASAMTWMVKYLDENPIVLDTLTAQHLSIAQRSSTQSCLALEDLNEMSFASKVVKESLRMASVVPWFPRLALKDCDVEGFKVKKGWNVNIDARSIHVDPTVYDDPTTFNPWRFDDDSKVPYSFLAFGIGGRTCLGLNMAKSMMLIFLHRLITTYKWRVTNSDSSIEKLALFSTLKSGCPVQITRLSE